MSKRRRIPDGELDMTSMIDVVFQLIIFFVTTIDMESKALETKVQMAMSPHGPVEEKKDPRTVIIDVEWRVPRTTKADGTPIPDAQLKRMARAGQIKPAGHPVIKIAQQPLTEAQLYNILKNVRINSGSTTPVVIRGDKEVLHNDIHSVMAVIGKAGLWKIRFAALKEDN